MNAPNSSFQINSRRISIEEPTYFIADVAANHDGDLGRAKDLIHLAAESGADAAKFQHFKAKTIVSDFGFKALGAQSSHQAAWKKSVFDVYDGASLNEDWTASLRETCKEAGIDFFTSPYSYELVDYVDPFVPAYKIGSGDITWNGIIQYIASKGKPVILASGASSMTEVQVAMDSLLECTGDVALMQCNTNYTASLENFKYIQLNVLKSYAAMYPGMLLGLSDHTPGHATVLGAVTLGARLIEKHFTDDNGREGPDHKFSMDPESWRDMVGRTRELEAALGAGCKRVEANEAETVVLQRRCVRATRALRAGETIEPEMMEVLRPSPPGSIQPNEQDSLVGKKIRCNLDYGEALQWKHLE